MLSTYRDLYQPIVDTHMTYRIFHYELCCGIMKKIIRKEIYGLIFKLNAIKLWRGVKNEKMVINIFKQSYDIDFDRMWLISVGQS